MSISKEVRKNHGKYKDDPVGGVTVQNRIENALLSVRKVQK